MPSTNATAVSTGISSAAASRAASGIGAHGRRRQSSVPKDQAAAASSSAAHSVSAMRLNARGAETTPRNSQPPNVIHTVKAAATSMLRDSGRSADVRQATCALKHARETPT